MKIIARVETHEELAKLQADFDLVASWCSERLIQSNVEKFGVMNVKSYTLIGKDGQRHVIRQMVEEHDLGAIIILDFKFNTQASYAAIKLTA